MTMGVTGAPPLPPGEGVIEGGQTSPQNQSGLGGRPDGEGHSSFRGRIRMTVDGLHRSLFSPIVLRPLPAGEGWGEGEDLAPQDQYGMGGRSAGEDPSSFQGRIGMTTDVPIFFLQLPSPAWNCGDTFVMSANPGRDVPTCPLSATRERAGVRGTRPEAESGGAS